MDIASDCSDYIQKKQWIPIPRLKISKDPKNSNENYTDMVWKYLTLAKNKDLAEIIKSNNVVIFSCSI